MKYEIKWSRKIQSGTTTMTFDDPHWIIYFEGKTTGPYIAGFSKLEKALKHFIDGIGTNEGIIRIAIETLKEEPKSR